MVVKHIKNNNQEINIKKIYEAGLCTGCGTCAGICPKNAVKMEINWPKGVYEPVVDNEKCNSCGSCYESCPGHCVDFKDLSEFVFGNQSGKNSLSNYNNCFIGYSTDYNLRSHSSSGGLVTQLLIFMLEEGIINGALVTRLKKDKPLEPEPFIARTKEEIIAASGSKFSPVAVNSVLNEIINSKKGEKFAIVGLPCHLHGIRKAEKKDKELKEKIVLHLGLFCDSFVPSFTGVKYFMKRMGIRISEIKKIDYRQGEFPPGTMRIEHRKITQVDHLKFWNTIFYLPFIFSPPRCMLCCDSKSSLSDISFGSWWRMPEENINEKTDCTAIICRNDRAEEIINKAQEKLKINLIKIDSRSFFDLKHSNFKKLNLARLSILKYMGKNVPDYNLKLPRLDLFLFVKNIPFYLELVLSSKVYLRGLLNIYIMIKKCSCALIKKAVGK